MRVTMTLDYGETLVCDNCGEFFREHGYLDINNEAECVQSVYCALCGTQSLATTAREE